MPLLEMPYYGVEDELDLPRSSLRYTPVARDEQAALARRIEELAGAHPRFGYRRIWALLDREGWSVNTKAVRRIWRLSGLTLARPRATPKPRRSHGQDGNACHLRPSRGKDDVTGSGALYVAPASPWQNGYAESFHSKLRDEFLDREEFESEPQARALGALW